MPGMRVASMKRISPPTGVQASPVATPACVGALSFTSEVYLGMSEVSGGGTSLVRSTTILPSLSRLRGHGPPRACGRSRWRCCRSSFAHAGLDRV